MPYPASIPAPEQGSSVNAEIVTAAGSAPGEVTVQTVSRTTGKGAMSTSVLEVNQGVGAEGNGTTPAATTKPVAFTGSASALRKGRRGAMLWGMGVAFLFELG